MKIMLIRLLLIIVTFSPAMSIAGGIADKTVQELLEVSGINKQVAELPKLTQAGIEQAIQQRGDAMDNRAATILRTVAANAVSPDAIIKVIGNNIASAVSEKEANSLLSFLKSDLGREITKAEEAASTVEAQQEMIQNAQKYLSDQERLKLAQELDQSINATEFNLDVQRNIGIVTFSAISKALAPDKPVQLKAFIGQLDAQQAQMKASVRQYTLLGLVYNYRNIETDKIKRYIEFLKKPESQSFNDSVMNGMRDGIMQSVEVLTKTLTEKLPVSK